MTKKPRKIHHLSEKAKEIAAKVLKFPLANAPGNEQPIAYAAQTGNQAIDQANASHRLHAGRGTLNKVDNFDPALFSKYLLTWMRCNDLDTAMAAGRLHLSEDTIRVLVSGAVTPQRSARNINTFALLFGISRDLMEAIMLGDREAFQKEFSKDLAAMIEPWMEKKPS